MQQPYRRLDAEDEGVGGGHTKIAHDQVMCWLHVLSLCMSMRAPGIRKRFLKRETLPELPSRATIGRSDFRQGEIFQCTEQLTAEGGSSASAGADAAAASRNEGCSSIRELGARSGLAPGWSVNPRSGARTRAAISRSWWDAVALAWWPE
eukprot:SAG31_NODE_993_length_10512_cov_20.777202_10_plen_150_part_00